MQSVTVYHSRHSWPITKPTKSSQRELSQPLTLLSSKNSCGNSITFDCLHGNIFRSLVKENFLALVYVCYVYVAQRSNNHNSDSRKTYGKTIWFYFFLITGEKRKKLKNQRLKRQCQFQCRSYLDPAQATNSSTLWDKVWKMDRIFHDIKKTIILMGLESWFSNQ